jgi:predicted dehydrogenase
MKPIKLGMIGCGIAATNLHLPALRNLTDRFDIALICNNSENKAREFAAMVDHIPYVLDYREMLENPEIEAVDIALPIHLNYEVTKAVLDAGKHVLVEKPIAVNREDAAQMLALEKMYPGQVKMIAENFLYHPCFRYVKKVIADKTIGNPYAVFWDVFRLVDRNNRYAKTSWRLDKPLPGGFIADGGIHNIAAIQYIFGDIINGQANAKQVNPEIGVMDSFSMQFDTSDGIHGVLNIQVSTQGFFENRIKILGDKGSILIENNNLIKVVNNDGIVSEKHLQRDTSYEAEFIAFFDAIRENAPVVSDFERGYVDFIKLMDIIDTAERWPTLKVNP